jgi:hypothetical protein
MQQVLDAGFTPMAMLWDEYYKYCSARNQRNWREFQRQYARPGIIHAAQKRTSTTQGMAI